MEESVEIYVLTHKKFTESYDANLYKPLLCGAINSKQDVDYIRDDTGDNISSLNNYYSEFTGEYWVWKNTDLDIIGFCHYRRWYVKNLKWDKLTKEDIINDLKDYDIILPHNLKFTRTLYDEQKTSDIKMPKYDVSYEDYIKVGEVLERFFPDYAECYQKVMNGKWMWTNNIFICKCELAYEYFEWIFSVFDKLTEELDLSAYDSRDSRVFGFLGERLFTTYILKNKLKFKEYDLLFVGTKFPIMEVIYARDPRLRYIKYGIHEFLKRLKIR